MSDNKPTINIAIPTPLFLIFLVLKLTHVIDWSWWLVTSPLWVPFVFFFGFLGILFLIGLLAAVLK